MRGETNVILSGPDQEDGVSETTIVIWKKGKIKPIKQNLERLEKILGDLLFS